MRATTLCLVCLISLPPSIRWTISIMFWDYDVLTERLSRTYGIRSTALDWLRSYLCDRRQTILFDPLLNCPLFQLWRPSGLRARAAAVPALHCRPAPTCYHVYMCPLIDTATSD